MAAFHFRAAVALDLRRREETTAAAALSRAEARFHEAEAERDRSDAERVAAQADLVAIARRGIDPGALEWHRNWIVRLAANAGRRRREVDDRARDVRTATTAWHECRRRRLALERLRDRAWRQFAEAERRDENRAMDELARIRFVMAEPERE
jgi:flagellar export protein FliJ